MQETHHLLLSSPKPLPTTTTTTTTTTTKLPNYPSKPTHLPPNNHHHHHHHPPKFPSLKTTPNQTHPKPQYHHHHNSSNDFQSKLLYLDSLGIDLLTLLPSYPPLITAPLPTLKSSTKFLLSTLSLPALRRVALLCPEALTLSVPRRLAPVLAFLLREAQVPPNLLARVLTRRPRLLACPVPSLLRPTLYFLQSLGIVHPHKHPNLLTSPVETKLLPRLQFITATLHLSPRQAAAMFRRFPQLFCYSVAANLQPKLDFFLRDMGRHPSELAHFPQYFSFSLENRIKPRHRSCVDKGVCFPLPVLLRTTDREFRSRLEVCCEASMPRATSPLFCTNCDFDSFL